MTPPRLIWAPGEYTPLSCETCDDRAMGAFAAGAHMPLAPPDGGVRPYTGALDSFTTVLPSSDLLTPAPFRGPRLLNIEWGRIPGEGLPSGLSPRLALLQPVRPLSGAYLASERLSFVDFVPGLAALADGIERLDLDFFNIPVNRGGGHCRFSEFSPRTERVHDCNVAITAGTTARAHGEIRPIRGTDESLITRVVIDFRPNLLNHSTVTLEIDGFSAVDSPGFDFGDRSFRGRHRESVVSWPIGDTGYENPLGAGVNLVTPFESTAAPTPGDRRSWMFRFSPVVGDVIDLLAQTLGERQLHLWAYLPTAGLVNPESYESLGIPYNTFPRRFGDVIRLLAPLFSRSSREALRHAGPYFNPNTEYLDFNGRRQFIPNDPAELARLNRERAAYNRAHPDEVALSPLINRGPVLDWVFTDLLSDPVRLAALVDATPAELPAITSRIRFNETELELPIGTMTVRAGTEARIHYGLHVERAEGGGVDARAFGRLTLEPIRIGEIDLEVQNYLVHASALRADRVVIYAPDLQALFSGTVAPEDGLQVVLEGVHLEGLRLADRRTGLGGELGSADVGSLRFSYHSDAWHLTIGGEEAGSGIRLGGLSIETLLGRVTFEHAVIPEIRVRSTARRGETGRGVTVEVPTLRTRSRMDFTYYPPRSDSPLRLALEGGSSLSNLLYYYRPNAAIRHQARFDVEGQVREARIEHEMIGAIILSTLRSPDAETVDPMRGRVQFRILNPDLVPEDDPPRSLVQPDISLELPFMAIGSDSSVLTIPRATSTIEHGRLDIHADSYAIEGNLNIVGATLRGMGDGRLELGDSVIAAEDMAIGLRASGPARFEYSTEGWRLMRTPDAAEPLSLGLTVNNLGFIHFNDPSFLPPPVPRDPIPEAFQTRLHIANAEVEVPDLRAIFFQRFQEREGEVRGRLTRIESGPITAHHIEGSGAIWAPLAIWGMVRGLFPVLGRDSRETPPTRPDPAPLVAHLPPEVLCALEDEDFFRIGSVDYRYYPLSPASRISRSSRSLRSDPPRGDWEVRIEDMILNIHEAAIPGISSRSQFALMRIPGIRAGRLWVDETRSRYQTCAAAPDAVCGEERPFWNLGLGEFLGSFYLNDPQRGGSFLFRRGLSTPPEHGLAELLSACPAP